jgi:hypothetical protein
LWRTAPRADRPTGSLAALTANTAPFTVSGLLVWAVLDLFCHANNGATVIDVGRQHLYCIEYKQADQETADEEVTAA